MVVGVPDVSCDIAFLVERAVKLGDCDQPVVEVGRQQVFAEFDVEKISPFVAERNILRNLLVALAVRRVYEDELIAVGVGDQWVLVLLEIWEGQISTEEALQLASGRLLGAIDICGLSINLSIFHILGSLIIEVSFANVLAKALMLIGTELCELHWLLKVLLPPRREVIHDTGSSCTMSGKL